MRVHQSFTPILLLYHVLPWRPAPTDATRFAVDLDPIDLTPIDLTPVNHQVSDHLWCVGSIAYGFGLATHSRAMAGRSSVESSDISVTELTKTGYFSSYSKRELFGGAITVDLPNVFVDFRYLIHLTMLLCIHPS